MTRSILCFSFFLRFSCARSLSFLFVNLSCSIFLFFFSFTTTTLRILCFFHIPFDACRYFRPEESSLYNNYNRPRTIATQKARTLRISVTRKSTKMYLSLESSSTTNSDHFFCTLEDRFYKIELLENLKLKIKHFHLDKRTHYPKSQFIAIETTATTTTTLSLQDEVSNPNRL